MHQKRLDKNDKESNLLATRKAANPKLIQKVIDSTSSVSSKNWSNITQSHSITDASINEFTFCILQEVWALIKNCKCTKTTWSKKWCKILIFATTNWPNKATTLIFWVIFYWILVTPVLENGYRVEYSIEFAPQIRASVNGKIDDVIYIAEKIKENY